MAGMPPSDWLTLMASGVVMDLVASEASSAGSAPIRWPISSVVQTEISTEARVQTRMGLSLERIWRAC
ncbi:hypothetical protein D3C76_1344650 [compost metagenome]